MWRGIAGFVGVMLALLALTPAGGSSQTSEAALVVNGPGGAVRADGESASFTIEVQGATNLGGFEFVLAFDSDLFEFDHLEQGSFLGSTGRQVVCDDPQSAAGAVRMLCVTLEPEPEGASGDGTLATIWLRPKGEGETEVFLSRYKLTTVRATALPVRVESATVRVGDDGGGGSLMWAGIAGGVALAAVVGAGLYARRRSSRT